MTHDEFSEPGVIPLYDSHFAGGTHVSAPHFSFPAGVALATTGGGALAGFGAGSTLCGPGDWGVVDGEHEAVSARSTARRSRIHMSAG
jgi:hypothetical protein